MEDFGWVETRLRLGEDTQHEFRSVVRSNYRLGAERLANTVAAMANSGGGWILVGVDDDGFVSGVGAMDKADALQLQVSQVCQSSVFPPLPCGLFKVPVGERFILLVHVPGGAPGRPFRAREGYFLRDGPRNRVATTEELRTLLQSHDFHYDEQPLPDTRAETDLSQVQVEEFLKLRYGRPVGSDEARRLLRAQRCVDDAGHLTVAGALNFTGEPQRWLRDAGVTAVRFEGGSLAGRVLDRQDIGGPLLVQVEEARRFLRKHLERGATVQGTVRVESGLPDEVAREALVNAVSHRDYRLAAQTRLLVFDDRVEVTSPGGLINSLTLDSIRAGITRRRNPVVCAILNQWMRRENIGSGIPRMLQLMAERGLPEPELDVVGGQFRVTLRVAAGA